MVGVDPLLIEFLGVLVEVEDDSAGLLRGLTPNGHLLSLAEHALVDAEDWRLQAWVDTSTSQSTQDTHRWKSHAADTKLTSKPHSCRTQSHTRQVQNTTVKC